MGDLNSELKERVFYITFNREKIHNAFDDALLLQLQILLAEAEKEPEARVIVLKANGRHFSAGADLNWMKRMAEYSEAENIADATLLAQVMNTLYNSSKPTIAMVQGAAYGGGAGLVAACDIAIAADNARFCFSEVKLGLIPAVISPYVIKAIGARNAACFFMSAEPFDAKRALELQLLHYIVSESNLLLFTTQYAQKMARLAPLAVKASKSLVRTVEGKPIDKQLMQKTAQLIANKRISPEGQQGLQAFLQKETPAWD